MVSAVGVWVCSGEIKVCVLHNSCVLFQVPVHCPFQIESLLHEGRLVLILTKMSRCFLSRKHDLFSV